MILLLDYGLYDSASCPTDISNELGSSSLLLFLQPAWFCLMPHWLWRYMRSNMFIRFIFIKWLSGVELFLYIKRGLVTYNHWLCINRSSLISYCHWLIFARIIFILNDNRFFLHNPMSFNRFILMNMLEVDSLSYRLSEPHIRDCLATPARSALNYW